MPEGKLAFQTSLQTQLFFVFQGLCEVFLKGDLDTHTHMHICQINLYIYIYIDTGRVFHVKLLHILYIDVIRCHGFQILKLFAPKTIFVFFFLGL